MANAQFLSALLKPVGDELISREERKMQEKINAKKERIALLQAAMPYVDDPNVIMNEIWNLTGGGKSKGGRPNPGMQMIEKIVMQSGNAPANKPSELAAGLSLDGSAGGPRSIAEGLSLDGGEPRSRAFEGLDMRLEQIPTVVREQVPTSMGELPRLMTRAERDAAELEKYAAQQRIITEETRGRNAGKLTPGASVVLEGSKVPPDVETDVDGQPIDRRSGRYKVLSYQDGTRQYVPTEARPLTGAEAKVETAARNIIAAAEAEGKAPPTIEEARRLARVEVRVNELTERRLRVERAEQMMRATDQQMARGTQLYEQSAQMFPLMMAARQAGINLQEARLALVGGNPQSQLNSAFSLARQMTSNPRQIGYFGRPVEEVRDELVMEMFGKTTEDLQAEARVFTSRSGGGTSDGAGLAPAIDDPKKDPALRAKAKAALEESGLDSSDASIDKLLSDPGNVSMLRGGK